MSVNILSIISMDHLWTPSAAAAEAAAGRVRMLDAEAPEIETEFCGRVIFFEAGVNWQGVRCPRCRAVLSDDWFGARIQDAEAASEFADLEATTPCCGTASNLNRLDFVWPAGFASFRIEIRTPTRAWRRPSDPWLDRVELEQVEEILRTPLRQVLAHY